jgi:Flp pilus assembly CpaF family ATPase
MLNFILEYRFVILIILATILYAALEWQKFKTSAYALMLQAKRMAKDEILKSGDEQVEWIIKRSYQYLPKKLTIFISEERMRNIIRYLYKKLKDLIDDGQPNNSLQ